MLGICQNERCVYMIKGSLKVDEIDQAGGCWSKKSSMIWLSWHDLKPACWNGWVNGEKKILYSNGGDVSVFVAVGKMAFFGTGKIIHFPHLAGIASALLTDIRRSHYLTASPPSLSVSEMILSTPEAFFCFKADSFTTFSLLSGVTRMGIGWANPRAPGLRGHSQGAPSLLCSS